MIFVLQLLNNAFMQCSGEQLMKDRCKKLKPDDDEMTNLTRHKKKLRYLKARRRVIRLQENLKKFRVLARFSIIVLLCIFMFRLFNMHYWYLSRNIFDSYPNKSLMILGNKIVSKEQVLDRLKQVKLPRKPLYMIDTKTLEESVKKLAPVRNVSIRRYLVLFNFFQFPHRANLQVKIDEKTPIFAVSPSPKVSPLAVFMDDGTIIGKEFLPLKNMKDLYTIFTYEDFNKWLPKDVRFIRTLASNLETYSSEKLHYLDIRNPEDVYAQLDDIRLRLGEIDPIMETRIKRISKEVIAKALTIKAGKSDNDIDYIDLRWEESLPVKLKEKAKIKPKDKQKTDQNDKIKLADNETSKPVKKAD